MQNSTRIINSLLASLLLLSFLVFLYYASEVSSIPSGENYPPNFFYRNGLWYDSWNITRNAWYGQDGYLPRIANESLGYNRELAYSLGQGFKAEYPEKVRRAEEILHFIQKWMKYGYDNDYVIMEHEGRYKNQEEWAWNADEMAHKIKDAQVNREVARGDCEDFAFLLGVIYLAADFEVAITSPEGHVALLIWLPEFPDANIYWDILDGKGYGWIWVEATGEKNPLGWTPPEFNDGRFDVYIIQDLVPIEIGNIIFSPEKPQPENEVTVSTQVRSENVTITQITLTYYKDGDIDREKVKMSSIGESVYESTIPRQKEGVTVTFYVEVQDSMGQNLKSQEISYEVGVEFYGMDRDTVILGLIVAGIISIFFFKSIQ